MSNLVVPNSFASGTSISSFQMNSNFQAIAAWANGKIDAANIGPAGVYASQVIPTSSAQATFGGAFGYTIAPGSIAQVPLTLAGVVSQTADLFDVTLTPGGTKALAVTAAGATTLLGPLQSASGYVPPVYNYDGSVTGTTEHVVRGVATVSVNSGAGAGTGAVSLVGAARFTSSSSYQVIATVLAETPPPTGLTSLITPAVIRSDGTNFSIQIYGNGVASVSGNVYVAWIAMGT